MTAINQPTNRHQVICNKGYEYTVEAFDSTDARDVWYEDICGGWAKAQREGRHVFDVRRIVTVGGR